MRSKWISKWAIAIALLLVLNLTGVVSPGQKGAVSYPAGAGLNPVYICLSDLIDEQGLVAALGNGSINADSCSAKIR